MSTPGLSNLSIYNNKSTNSFSSSWFDPQTSFLKVPTITMYKILNKSKPWLLRRPTPATSIQFQTNPTHLHRHRSRQYSQLSQLSEPTDDLQQESWRSFEGLVRCSANYVPLTPISFLERSADVYRDRTSVIYGSLRYTWEETHRRCVKLASALTQLGISRGDVVSFSPESICIFLILNLNKMN